MSNNNNESGQGPLTLAEISEAAKKRVALISEEFTDGFEFVKNYPRSVTFFGSARTKEGDYYYEKARNLAGRIVRDLRYSVVSGGGPGIMKAANRGAFEAGGNSVGLTIHLPKEQETNEYLTDHLNFHYFFSRKVCLSFSAEAYIFFPGGFGTLDEFLEITTLIQTSKIPKAPIILVGESYWRSLEQFFNEVLIKNNLIDEKDKSLYTITDDENVMLEIIKEAPVRMGIKYDNGSEAPNKLNHNHNAARPISELSDKHCLPCEGGVPPLPQKESETLLKEVSKWILHENKEIRKTYSFENFHEAVAFVNKVAIIAEQENHHPDINLRGYKYVDVRVSTHTIGGLSENDFILASKIDRVEEIFFK